ncbi:MAG: anthranilate phosphoribosyltransferase [Alphaproteobacteria bacterium]|nr:anthranilate phosphoribosyltransferase [Alphaproteobacteria bacterium]
MNAGPGDFRALIAHLAAGNSLSVEQSERAFDIMMADEATPAQMGGLLMALRVRGETVDEITGGAKAMRARAVPIDAPEGAIDTCGTGGDAKGTFNVSTGAAIVAAACGVPVAKHGNRALSSKSGSADVLTALGVNIEADMALVREALWQAGIGFLMAPRHHGAMRYVAPTRVELGTRTIFNLLGPLSNPAGAKLQLIGVFDAIWMEPMAEVLRNLGSERVWVVHGRDGMDELTTTGPSEVVELRGGELRRFEVSPEEAGLARATLDDIKGGDGGENARVMEAMLDGAQGPIRDIVLLNAAGALIVAGRAETLRDGVGEAAKAIDSGAARATLEKLVAITNASP